jgi:hypothetical protein
MDCRPESADPDVIIGQATMSVGWVSKKLPKNGLTHHEVEQFIDDGFVHLQEVVPPAIVTAGRKVMWADLAQNPDDPSAWTQPVVRLLPSDTRPFEKAFDNSRLHAAFDQLVGVGRWQPDQISGSLLCVSRTPTTLATRVGTSTAASRLRESPPRTTSTGGG